MSKKWDNKIIKKKIERHMLDFFEIERIFTLKNCVILLYVLRML